MKPLNIQHPPQGILTVRAAWEGGGGGVERKCTLFCVIYFKILIDLLSQCRHRNLTQHMKCLVLERGAKAMEDEPADNTSLCQYKQIM